MFYRRVIAAFPYWLPVIVWMGVIYYLSSLPESAGPGRDILNDKILHGIEYAIFGFQVIFALQRTTSMSFGACALLTLTLCTIYGLSDEIHQSYVPTRSCDVRDLLADMTGVLLVIGVLYLLTRTGRRGKRVFGLLMGSESP